MSRLLHHLRANRAGSVAMEFALLAPLLLAMMMGMFQVGIGMQNYNALRSVSADAARYAAVDAQKSLTHKSNTELETWVRSRATGYPYHLHGANLTVSVTTAATQRIAGATEKSIVLTYTVPGVTKLFGARDVTIRYTRPIFTTL